MQRERLAKCPANQTDKLARGLLPALKKPVALCVYRPQAYRRARSKTARCKIITHFGLLANN